jgi:DNA-binding NarL/FixJ family response regulator
MTDALNAHLAATPGTVTFRLKTAGGWRVYHVPAEEVRQWQDEFVREMPRITEHARVKFRHLKNRDPEQFEEKVHVCEENAWDNYVRERLKREKDPHAFISNIAEMAARHTKAHRDVAGQERIRDVTSERCKKRNGYCVQSFPEHDSDDGPNKALDALIDHRVGNPADLAVFAIDTPQFRDTLTPVQQAVMDGAVVGDTTSEMAERLKVTGGAVSQHRRKIAEKYKARNEAEPLSR